MPNEAHLKKSHFLSKNNLNKNKRKDYTNLSMLVDEICAYSMPLLYGYICDILSGKNAKDQYKYFF